MDENERIGEMAIDKDKEDKYFTETLAANKHIVPHQFISLRTWCKMQLKMETMGMNRELLRFSQEARLLGKSLKLMPERAQDVSVGLTTAMMEVMDE